MPDAKLGLELEYSCPKVQLTLEGEGTFSEKDFKSKHIIITNDPDCVKDLFVNLYNYGIQVTLDSKSGHGDFNAGTEIPLTIELILDHEKFGIKSDKLISEKTISLGKDFAEQVKIFTQFIQKQDRNTKFSIKFGEESREFQLEIPLVEASKKIVLSPHITIPCPLLKIIEIESEGDEFYNVAFYFYQILNALKACLKGAGEKDIKSIEKHDPKQNLKIIPKTSMGAILEKYVKKNNHLDIAGQITYLMYNIERIEPCDISTLNDYYVTEKLTIIELLISLKEMSQSGYVKEKDRLLGDLIGIGSIGDKFEIIGDEECPIVEFRSCSSFCAENISGFQTQLEQNLVCLYTTKDRAPFYFSFRGI